MNKQSEFFIALLTRRKICSHLIPALKGRAKITATLRVAIQIPKTKNSLTIVHRCFDAIDVDHFQFIREIVCDKQSPTIRRLPKLSRKDSRPAGLPISQPALH